MQVNSNVDDMHVHYSLTKNVKKKLERNLAFFKNASKT